LAIPTETFYRKYGPMVFRRCKQMLGDDDSALDAMHDVFVKVLVREDELDDRAPSSLLFRIATNVCLNRIRAEGRRREAVDDDLVRRIACSDDPERRSGARLSLSRLFGGEKESSQTIAVLHLLDGMTLEEVASEVGMSVSGVRKRLRRLRGQLIELEGM